MLQVQVQVQVGVPVAIRKAGVSVRDDLGDVDVVPTLVGIDELLFGLHREHPLYRANVSLLAQMDPPITNRPTIKFAADELIRAHADRRPSAPKGQG